MVKQEFSHAGTVPGYAGREKIPAFRAVEERRESTFDPDALYLKAQTEHEKSICCFEMNSHPTRVRDQNVFRAGVKEMLKLESE